MTGRLVVLPLRSEILLRSAGYGAGCGAATGAVVVALPAAIAAPYAPLGSLILMPIAATIGAIFGLACGLAGGVALIIWRRHLAGSRCAVRVVAGAGAGVVPATWMAALMTSSGRLWVPALVALTVVTAMLAAALGLHAFFGRPPRRRQRASSRPESGARREIVR
jgi:NO-binding membrane sensor protein with MHYT domain